MVVQTEAKPVKKHGTNQWTNDEGPSDKPKVHYGENPEYIAARLKRDHPEIQDVAWTGRLYTDSRNVADVFGKEHFNVLRDIDALKEQHSDLNDGFFTPRFGNHPTVVGRSDRFYELTKDGLTLLVMGYTGERNRPPPIQVRT